MSVTKIEWTGTPIPCRYGPAPNPPRNGDKKQARQRINVEVRTGRRPHPNSIPCFDCGHAHRKGGRRHEYDHHLGYAPQHHYDVQVVCTICHAVRDSARKKQTKCKHGHEFTDANTITAKNGTRHCRECRRLYDQRRMPRGSEFWKRINAKRKTTYGKNEH